MHWIYDKTSQEIIGVQEISRNRYVNFKQFPEGQIPAGELQVDPAVNSLIATYLKPAIDRLSRLTLLSPEVVIQQLRSGGVLLEECVQRMEIPSMDVSSRTDVKPSQGKPPSEDPELEPLSPETNPEPFLSLYEYLNHPAGIEEGKKMFIFARKFGYPFEHRPIKVQGKAAICVKTYPKKALDAYFHWKRTGQLPLAL